MCLAFLLVSSTTRAGEPWQSPDPDISLGHFPAKWAADLPHLFIDENIVPFAAGSLATALDWTTLDSRDTLASDLQHWNTQPLFDFGNFYGEGWVEGGGAVGSWVLGSLTGDLRLGEFGRDAAESLIDATVLATGLKYAVGRERPSGTDNLSFPSGHTITAFCFAPVVTKYFGWEAGIPAYLFGAVTGLARVEGYHHYLSDVLAGATLGIVIGNAVVYAPTLKAKDASLSVGPGTLVFKMNWD